MPASAPHTLPEPPDAMTAGSPHVDPATDALRYWERMRLAYNAVLVAMVGAIFMANWPAFVERASLDFYLGLFLLAVVANVLFCAAYVADVFVQRTRAVTTIRRARRTLLAAGTAFAAVLAQFIARGIVGAA